MTPADWRNLRDKLFSGNNFALGEAVGVSKNSATKYAKDDNEIPVTVALACAAVARGLKPWPE